LCIKHAARPIDITVSSGSISLASNEALEASASRKEASVEVVTSWSVEVSDNYENRSGDSKKTESASDDSERAKMVVVVTMVILKRSSMWRLQGF
jgi:hypothetical protein